MTQYGTWAAYSGAEALRLAIALFIIAAILAFFGFRLRRPLQPRKTGWFAGGVLALIWLVSWETLGVNGTIYYEALVKAVGQFTPPASPITPVTFFSGLLGFVAIIILGRRSGWRTALGGAIVGMMAAPMIFELPFDLMVMWRLYPPVPTQNVLLFFLPLFLISLSSFGLLTVSPLARLSRYSVFCLAGLFLTFAIWALLGFAYPSQPMLFVLNATGKVLAFAAAVTLFIQPS